MVAGQFLDKGQTPLLWEVARLWFSFITDVAFLRLSPTSKEAANHVCTGVSMNLLPRRVGTRIAAFGYHSASIELSEEDDEQIIFEWNDPSTTSVGEVIQVYDERRESVMLPFPCFQTNARFKYGMSGGPIFNDSGQLCGLICTSMEDVSENETEHTSYAASLWPSMGTQIDADRQGFPCGLTYPALELAQHGHIPALGWERIRINKVAERTNVRILY